MTDDIVQTLGYATLGSRLKRLGEKLQAQTGGLVEGTSETGLPVPQNPVLAALDSNGSMSIAELTKALGQSQPGVTRMINQMKRTGLVTAQACTEDARVTRICLSGEGQKLVSKLKASLWPAAFLSVSDACSGLSGTLLDQLTQLEDALDQVPLKRRPLPQPLPDWDDLKKTEGTD